MVSPRLPSHPPPPPPPGGTAPDHSNITLSFEYLTTKQYHQLIYIYMELYQNCPLTFDLHLDSRWTSQI